jgi:hypothetical protein
VHRFATEAGPGRIDYYFVAPTPAPRRPLPRPPARSRRSRRRQQRRRGRAALNLYIRARDGIGAAFRGTPETLRGRHFNALLSYTRWSGGQLDIFYIIESGRSSSTCSTTTPSAHPEFE